MSDAETIDAPSKAERTGAFRQASWAERVSMHERIARHKGPMLEERRELGRRYLEQHGNGVAEVPFEKGVALVNLDAMTREARADAIAKADGQGAQANNGSLEFPVLAKDFEADSPSMRFGMHPHIVAPIVRYCGMLPILFNMFVTRAHTTELLEKSPHFFHLDPEDTISFKVFVHLTDVDADCGPFHALRADSTQAVIARLGYRGIERITDAQVEELVGWKNVTQALGPAGTVVFADTTRCLHFGGRPRKPGKPVRDMLVFQYLLPTSLLFPIDGDGQRPNFMTTLEPNGDPTWDALIGARLT